MRGTVHRIERHRKRLERSITLRAHVDYPKPLVVAVDRASYDLASSADFARELERSYAQATVVLDLSTVTYLDSTCLSKLLRMRRERAKRGLPLEHIVLSDPIRRLFAIVKFDEIWPLYDSLDMALEFSAVAAAVEPRYNISAE